MPAHAAPARCAWYQSVPAPAPGTILHLAGRVRTERVAGGTGARIALHCCAEDGERIARFESRALTGDHGWTEVRLWATVPPGARSVTVVLLLQGRGAAAFGDVALAAHAGSAAAHAPRVELGLTPERFNAGLYGFGVETNPQALLPPNAMAGEDMRLLQARLGALRPAWVRVFTHAAWWVTASGYDFTLPGARAIRDVLRLYEGIGSRANLVLWRSGSLAPTEPERMAEAMAALIRWLRAQGVGNIRALTLYNEADQEFPGTPAEYVELYRVTAAALRRGGLDDVQLVGADVTHNGEAFFEAVAPPLRGSIGMLSYHEYAHYGSSLAVPVERAARMAAAARSAGTPDVFQWESNLTGGRGAGTFSPGVDPGGTLLPALHGSALKLAAFYLQALAAGLKGICYWEAFDFHYGTEGEVLMEFGLWGSRADGYPLRPIYYVYQLLARLIRPGAALLRVQATPAGAVIACAVERGGGRRAVYVLNPWDRPVRARVRFGSGPLSVRRWRLDRDTLARALREAPLALPAARRRLPDGVADDVVAAEALTVYDVRRG